MAQGRRQAQLTAAIDTNIVLRLIRRDDEHQTVIAESLLRDGVFVPVTVLMETVWVLDSYYGLPNAEIAHIIRDLLDLPDVSVRDSDLVRWAFERFAAGADIADMIHLVEARDMDRFATFDRGIARKAGPRAPVPIETLG